MGVVPPYLPHQGSRSALGGPLSGGWRLHITYKKLKAVRYAVLTFLTELRGRQVLLHEDNMGVVHILVNLTFPSPLLSMTKLRKLWSILDTNDIFIRARYIMAD
eukprot:jgi/Tetstr1/447663/TSEL_035021.t1